MLSVPQKRLSAKGFQGHIKMLNNDKIKQQQVQLETQTIIRIIFKEDVPGSTPWCCMWNLWWKSDTGMWFFSVYFCFQGLVLFHQCSVLINLLKPTGHVMHQKFNIQQLYALPTLYLCVLYLSEKKQRLVPHISLTDWLL